MDTEISSRRVTRGYKFRLDVGQAEIEPLTRFTDARRKAWNSALGLMKEVYGLDAPSDNLRALAYPLPEEDLDKPSDKAPWRYLDQFALLRLMNGQKETRDRGIPANLIEYAVTDLIHAVSNFAAARKAGRKASFPRFARYSDPDATFSVRGAICAAGDEIALPSLSPLRVLGSTRHLERHLKRYHGLLKLATIRRHAGRWYCSVPEETLNRAWRLGESECAKAHATPVVTLLTQEESRPAPVAGDVLETQLALASNASCVINPSNSRFGTLLPDYRGKQPVLDEVRTLRRIRPCSHIPLSG